MALTSSSTGGVTREASATVTVQGSVVSLMRNGEAIRPTGLIFFIFWGGVRLGPLGTSATVWSGHVGFVDKVELG
jgi:hypothetical protein